MNCFNFRPDDNRLEKNPDRVEAGVCAKRFGKRDTKNGYKRGG